MIKALGSLDRVLKGQATDVRTLRAGTIDVSVRGLAGLLVLLGAIYGICMGTFAVAMRWGAGEARLGFLQMGYSAVKVPMLFVFTLAVTLPSLYVFNALVGCRLLFSVVVRLLVAALGVTLAVLASFGTIIAFFSLCTTSYPFMVLLNVATFALAGLLGMNFLLQTLHRFAVAQTPMPEVASSAAENAAPPPQVGESQPLAPGLATPPPIRQATPPGVPGALDRITTTGIGPQVRMVFAIWVIVFGLVGSQMGWILRPFIGAPDAPVSFFRSREGSFFQAVFDKVEDLANGNNPHTRSTNWR
ncbi:MAG TPA: hypothetical protein VIM11_23675 [Tepidisphaeraceae bacterium]|jgi:hypothetical protein